MPSPPPAPSTPLGASDLGTAIAIEAPTCSYLKYSLPPVRPSISRSDVGQKHNAKRDTYKRGSQNNVNEGDWGPSANNANNDSWNDDSANQKQWSNGNSWDGAPSNNNAMGNSSQIPRRSSEANIITASARNPQSANPQVQEANVSGDRVQWDLPEDIPPPPPPPPDWKHATVNRSDMAKEGNSNDNTMNDWEAAGVEGKIGDW